MSNVLFTTGHEVEVIAGHMYDIPFEVYTEDGNSADLHVPGTIIEWRLSPYGFKNIMLVHKTNANNEIELEANPKNTFVVHVLEQDTESLDGVYTSQITIIDPAGHVSRTYEGRTIIRSRI